MKAIIILVSLCLAAGSASDRLGEDVWKELRAAEGGLDKVKVLVRHADAVRDLELDEPAGRELAAEIMSGFPWREKYVDRLHQRDLFQVKDLVLKNRLRVLSWLFVAWLTHPDAYVRLHGTQRLADLEAKRHARAVAACLDDPDDRVRLGAATALGAFGAGEYAGKVAKLLADPDDSVRRHTIDVVAQLAGRAMTAEIVRCLADPEPYVRARAAGVLERIGAKDALPALRAAAAKEDRVEEIMAAAIRNLEAQRGERRPVKVVLTDTGPKCSVPERSYRLITTAGEWEKTWKLLRRNRTLPVDFGKHMAVAIFLGDCWNSRGVGAEVTEDDERIRVRFGGMYYQTMNHADRVTPYGLFVIPRSTKPVVLEENAQGLIGADPIWEERAVLGR